MNKIASANWLLSSRRQRMDASVLTCTAITDMGFRPSTWIRPAARQPVNSSHGQLVTRLTRHTINSSQVNSLPGVLVTQSTRHKEVVNSSQANKQISKPYCRSSDYPKSAIAAITQKMHKKLSRKQSEQQSTRTTCDRVNLRPLLKPTSL